MNTSPNLNLNLPELTDTADITPITANFSAIDTFAGNVYVKTEVYTKTEVDTFLASKADSATTYTKVEVDTLLVSKANDNAVVKLTGDQDISGRKTFRDMIYRQFTGPGQNAFRLNNTDGNTYLYSVYDADGKYRGYFNHQSIRTGDTATRLLLNTQSPNYDTSDGTGAVGTVTTELIPDGRYELRMGRSNGSGNSVSVQIAKILANGSVQSGLLDSYETMVRTANAQTIGGAKTFTEYIRGMLSYNRYLASGTNGGKWVKIGVLNAVSLHVHFKAYWRYGFAEVTSTMSEVYIHYNRWEGSNAPEVACIHEADGTFTLWWKHTGNYQVAYICDLNVNRYGGGAPDYFTPSDDTVYDAPVIGEGATALTVGVIDEPSTYVHTMGNETVGGRKTFTTDPVVQANVNAGLETYSPNFEKSATFTAFTRPFLVVAKGGSNIDTLALIQAYAESNDRRGLDITLYGKSATPSFQLKEYHGTTWAIVPTRGYNEGQEYVNDVATIGTLDGYLPMVRTTGSQLIAGVKRFTGRNVNAGQIMTASASAGGKWFKVATMPKQAGAVSRTMLFMFDNAAYSTGWWGMFVMTFGATTYLPSLKWIAKNPSWTTDTDSVAVGSSGGFWEIWLRSNASSHKAAISLIDLCTEVWNQEYNLTLIDPTQQTEESAPTSDTSINYIS